MPYIKQEDRERLAIQNDPKNEGELNYLLTLEYNKIIEEKGESYSNYGSLRTDIQILAQYYTNVFLSGHHNSKNPIPYNIFIHNVISNFFEKNNDQYHIKAENIKMVIGALINSSEELYRVKIAPYEDRKMFENGPV